MKQSHKMSKLPPNFIVSNNRYNIQSSIWKPQKISEEVPSILSICKQKSICGKIPNLASINRSIKFFAPATFNRKKAMQEQNSKPQKGGLYSISLLTGMLKQETKNLKDGFIPQYRQQYGVLQYEGQICIFGGKNKDTKTQQINYFQDLYKYCPYTATWTALQNNTISQTIPSPRVPQIFAVIQGNFFVFSGQSKHGILSDAYLFMQNNWQKLCIINEDRAYFISKLRDISYCVHNQSIYTYGGFDQQKQLFTDSFVRIKINCKDKTVEFQQINIPQYNVQNKINKPPCARSNHSMVSIDSNYIAIVGGRGLAIQKKYQKHSFQQRIRTLKDIIFYDVNNNCWQRVHPLNGPITFFKGDVFKKIETKSVYYHHSIYIIASWKQDNQPKMCFFEVQFSEYEVIRPQMCGNCTDRIKKQKEQPLDKKSPFLSNGLIYNLAFSINFPFQAVGLIFDCALQLQAKKISLKSNLEPGKYNYLQVKFNGKGISHQKFKSLCSHTYLPQQQANVGPKFMQRLKIGCLRLGRTFLFLNTCCKTGFRRAFFFSTDSLIIHDYQTLYNYMSYEESIKQNYISTKDGIFNKKYIINYLKAYTLKPDNLLDNRSDQSVILIFETNTLSNEDKQHHPQLIQRVYNNGQQSIPIDIMLHKDLKKAEFLTNLGYNMTNNPQISLKSYLDILYLSTCNSKQNNTLGFEKIMIQGQKFVPDCSSSYYKFIENNLRTEQVELIENSVIELKDNIKFKCLIAKALKPLVLNHGILIYYKKRLINRYQTKLGELFWRKFYKNRYKKSSQYQNFEYLGIVQVQSGLIPNFCMNEFVKNNQSRKFYSKLNSILTKKHQEKALSIKDNSQQGIVHQTMMLSQPNVQKIMQNSQHKLEIIPNKQKVQKKILVIDLLDNENFDDENCEPIIQKTQKQKQQEQIERIEGTKKVKRDQEQ